MRHRAPEQERQEEAGEGAVQTGAQHPRAAQEDHRRCEFRNLRSTEMN